MFLNFLDRPKMLKFKVKIFILVLVVIVSIFPVVDNNATNESLKNENITKYLIVKIDDFGYGNWTPILQAFQNYPNFVADIGVIGYNLEQDPTNQHLLTELLTTGRIDIFNHGWDHNIPEFQNHTVNYMVNHINLWNQFMYDRYGLKNEFILGAPGNAISKSCNGSVYQAMNETGYKVLFFSHCFGNTNDGSAGLNIPYLYVENDCAANCHFNPISYTRIEQGMQDLAQYQTIFIQIHLTAGYYWNYNTITNFLNFMYEKSGRIGITMTNYYNQIFLPSHPNYFLRNSVNQFIKSETSLTSQQNDIIIQPISLTLFIYGVVSTILIIILLRKKTKNKI